MIKPRRLIPGMLLLGSSAATAVGFAFALWEFFLYESIRRTTLEDRFFLWEGVLWMGGIALICFGIAAAFNALHLLNIRMPSLEEIYSHSHIRPVHEDRFSLLSVWMVLTGAILIALATWGRAHLLI